MSFIRSFVTRLFCIILYSIILIFLFKISFDELLNIKELILVIVGAMIFTIPLVIEEKNRNVKGVISRIPVAALESGIFTSIVLIVLFQKRISFNKSIFQTVFICFRPALYGIILYFLFFQKKIYRG